MKFTVKSNRKNNGRIYRFENTSVGLVIVQVLDNETISVRNNRFHNWGDFFMYGKEDLSPNIYEMVKEVHEEEMKLLEEK